MNGIMTEKTTDKTEVQRKQTLEKAQLYLELLKAQDWDKWIDLWADDAILEFPFAPDNRPSVYRGKQDILTYMSSTTKSIVVDSVAGLKISPMLDPDNLVIELAINGHLISNGAIYNQRYVTFFEFESGKIKHYREYWNPVVSIEAYGSYEVWKEFHKEL
jgi:ketosteroid isomerase-like protein